MKTLTTPHATEEDPHMAERRRYPDTGVRPTVDPQQTSPNDAHRCQAEPTEQEEVIMSEPFIFINSFLQHQDWSTFHFGESGLPMRDMRG